jgi:hypothetical protein
MYKCVGHISYHRPTSSARLQHFSLAAMLMFALSNGRAGSHVLHSFFVGYKIEKHDDRAYER